MTVPAKTVSPPAQSRRLRLAHLVSNILSPLYVGLPLLLGVAYKAALQEGQTTPGGVVLATLKWFVVAQFFLSLVPTLNIIWGIRRKRLSDAEITRREERTQPLLVALASTLLCFGVLLWLHAPPVILALTVAIIANSITTSLITIFLRWKISLHTASLAGAITLAALIFHPLFWLGLLLVPLMGWSRVVLERHSPLQTFVGGTLAVFVTIAAYLPLG